MHQKEHFFCLLGAKRKGEDVEHFVDFGIPMSSKYFFDGSLWLV
jgi:hypothetical protein